MGEKACQFDACRAAVPTIAEGAVDVAEFVDFAPGHATAARPSLEAMMRLCRSGAIKTVVVTDATRLSRDGIELFRMVEELTGVGVDVIAADRGRLQRQDVAIQGFMTAFAHSARRTLRGR